MQYYAVYDAHNEVARSSTERRHIISAEFRFSSFTNDVDIFIKTNRTEIRRRKETSAVCCEPCGAPHTRRVQLESGVLHFDVSLPATF